MSVATSRATFRLGGWRRLWIVLSVLWLAGSSAWLWRAAPVDNAGEAALKKTNHFESQQKSERPPMVKVMGPDGSVFEFVEGTPEDAMTALMKRIYPDPTPWRDAAAIMILPIAAFWALGLAGVWVSAGFRQDRAA